MDNICEKDKFLDIKFMKEALKEARHAQEIDEVPVGAVLVKDEKIIAKAHNIKNSKNNALFHAEMIVLNKSMKKLKDWHLNECTLYVTLEPCPMCAGAVINARVGRVVFGASDKKAGCFGSIFDFSKDKLFNHKPQITSGILKEECGNILTEYFKSKRSK